MDYTSQRAGAGVQPVPALHTGSNTKASFAGANRSLLFGAALLCFTLAVLLLTGKSHAFGPPLYVGPEPNVGHKYGYVVARAVVLDDNGEPTLVEYNEDGTEAQTVSTSGHDWRKLKILAAADYLLYENRLDLFETQYEDTLAQDAELMSRQQFLQTTFKTADNQTVIPTPALPEGINSVLVRGQSSRYLPNPDELVLLKFSLDMTQEANVTENSVSMLVTEEGKILKVSEKRMGYRTGFYGKPNEALDPILKNNVEDDDEIFGPLEGIGVTVNSDVYPGGTGITDEDGQYGFVFFMPNCPLGGFEFNTEIWVEMNYQTFMPNSSPQLPFFLQHPGYNYCYATLVPAEIAPAIHGILATTAIPDVQSNILVDIMFLSGTVTIENELGKSVSIGGTTEFSAFDEEADKTTQTHYDFNGDGEDDTVIEGTLTTLKDEDGNDVEAFVPESLSGGAESDYQGLYFDEEDAKGLETEPLDHQPDLIRVMDDEKRLEDTGFLSSLSESDFQNTDILFFRESTGQLIMERRGLRDEEINGGESAIYDNENERFAYRAVLRGPNDSRFNVGSGASREESFKEWATEYQLTEPFQEKEVDYIRAGEYITVVAINRATGYMGTERVELTSAKENADNNGGAANLSVEVPPITLRPPNLKIWAERDYTVEQGLTADEDRTYTIGNEGAGLTSDTTITIYTEWLDHDGSPLPDELGQDEGERYGLTGRLAKIVGANTLAAASISANGSDLAEFPIAPGRKVQAINVKSNLSRAEHYYVHVVGKAKDQECEAGATCPDFSKGSNPDPLSHRPGLLTPILTPVFDEDTHWETYNAYRELKREQDPGANDDELQKPLPSYAWHYRPEYQFSQFELEMQEINRIQEDENGDEQSTDIFELESPTITSGDKLIEALYSLISNQNERLTPIDGEQELILALGEHEQLVTIGEDQTIEFSNIEHLAQLDVEDYLSLRLYTNNDAGNVLWEYAFEYLSLETVVADFDPTPEEPHYVSADDPTVELQAVLIGYEDRDEATDISLRWGIEGDGSMSDKTQTNSRGVFENLLTLPTVAGSRATVTAKLVTTTPTTSSLGEFVVKAGKPSRIEIEQSGAASTAGSSGNLTVNITVYDDYGNLVSDGTVVNVTADGELVVLESDNFTVDGVLSVPIEGGSIPGNYDLTVMAGDVSKTVSVEVHPLNVQFLVADSTIFSDQEKEFSILVTDHLGNPVENQPVDLFTDLGLVLTQNSNTDASGRAAFTLRAGQYPAIGSLVARSGLNPVAERPLQVVVNLEKNPYQLNDSNLVIIGDQTTDGTLEYERLDGATINLPYTVNTGISLTGNTGDTTEVQIGTLSDPNLAPVAVYNFRNFNVTDNGGGPIGEISDEVRGHDISFSQPDRYQIEGDSPFGNIDNSIRFSAMGWMNLPENSASNVENFGLRLDFKPSSSGTLISNDRLALVFDGNRLILTVVTNQGSYQISSDILELSEWHSVGVKVADGEIALEVDSKTYPTVVFSGAVLASSDTKIGQAFQGLLYKLKWFDYSRQPLLEFLDGSQTKTIEFFANETQDFGVRSTGNLNAATGEVLQANRVAIRVGEYSRFINVMSSEAYLPMARAFADTLYKGDELPAIDLAGIGRASVGNPLGFMVPSAQAGWISDAASSFVESVSSVANILLPIEAVKDIYHQMNLMVLGDPNFDPLSLALSSVEVVSYFPIASPVRPLTRTVRQVYGLISRNTKAIKALGGFMDKVILQARRGNFTLIEKSLPFMLIAAEIYKEDPEIIDAMIDSIYSLDDLNTWIEFFALPGDAWDGEGIPSVELASHTGSLPFNSVFPQAYASKLKLPRGIGKEIKEVIREAISNAKSEIQSNPQALSGGLRSMIALLKNSTTKAIRSKAIRSTILGVTIKHFRNVTGNFKKLMGGKSNVRIHPVILLLSIAYLEDQYDSDDEEIYPEILKKYLPIVQSLAAKRPLPGKTLELSPQAHGAVFHLAMLAKYTLEGASIKGIEVRKNINIFKQERFDDDSIRRKANYKASKRYGRYIDLVLGKGSSPETWIELKSSLAKGKTQRDELSKNKFNTWNVNSKVKSSTEYHKQISLDRIAQTNNGALGAYKDGGIYSSLSSIKWRFQDFKVDYSSGGRIDYGIRLENSSSGICEKMKNPAGRLSSFAQEYKKNLSKSVCGSGSSIAEHTNVALELLDLLKSHYRDEITDEMVSQLKPLLTSD